MAVFILHMVIFIVIMMGIIWRRSRGVFIMGVKVSALPEAYFFSGAEKK